MACSCNGGIVQIPYTSTCPGGCIRTVGCQTVCERGCGARRCGWWWNSCGCGCGSSSGCGCGSGCGCSSGCGCGSSSSGSACCTSTDSTCCSDTSTGSACCGSSVDATAVAPACSGCVFGY